MERGLFVPASSGSRRWQRHRIAELHDLPRSVGIGNSEARKTNATVFDVDFPRLWNQVVQSFQFNVENVVLGIVSQTQQRQPLRLDLIAEIERKNLDLGLLGSKHLRDAVEKWLPLLLVELSDCHR